MGFLGVSRDGSVTCQCVSVNDMSYYTVYFLLALFGINVLGMLPPRGISGYFLQYKTAIRFECIIWLLLSWRLRVVMIPD